MRCDIGSIASRLRRRAFYVSSNIVLSDTRFSSPCLFSTSTFIVSSNTRLSCLCLFRSYLADLPEQAWLRGVLSSADNAVAGDDPF